MLGVKFVFCFCVQIHAVYVCVCASNPAILTRALEIKLRANKRPRHVGKRNHFTSVGQLWAIHAISVCVSFLFQHVNCFSDSEFN